MKYRAKSVDVQALRFHCYPDALNAFLYFLFQNAKPSEISVNYEYVDGGTLAVAGLDFLDARDGIIEIVTGDWIVIDQHGMPIAYDHETFSATFEQI
jgi:hypothetical protein